MFSLCLVGVLALIAGVVPAPPRGFFPFQNPFENPLLPTPLFPAWTGLVGPTVETNDDNFRVIVDVKAYNKEELKVQVTQGYILITGSHKSKQNADGVYSSQFSYSYSLPQNSSGAAVTASLYSDSKLVVDAPNTGSATKNNEDRDVPIATSDKAYGKDTAKPTGEDRKEVAE